MVKEPSTQNTQWNIFIQGWDINKILLWKGPYKIYLDFYLLNPT